VAESIGIAATVLLVFLFAAGILYIIDRVIDNWGHVDILRPVRRFIGTLIKGGSAARGILFRSLIAYFVYVGLVFPFVSRRKEEAVWVVGIPFALAVAYIWGRLRSGRA